MVTIPARQARAFRVIDNRTSKLTSWDTDLLPDALSWLNDLDIFSFDDVLPLAATAGKTDPDDIPETPKNPVTRTGDLWVLGKHRIVCGDSTNQETVERLLDGAEPDLMVTDPPYGVNCDATWRYRSGISSKDGAFGKSTNDDRCDWTDAYALFPGSIAYAWMSSLALPVAARGLDACGFVRRSLIIWDKGHIVIGRGHYHWRHETCWYAVKKGTQAHWKGGRKASTIWEIKKTQKSETGHSAQKPVECMQRAIHNHQGDVYDPFVGSGTTVIAGEQEGRTRLRPRDRACLRRRDGQAVGRLHRPEGNTGDNAMKGKRRTPLPRPPTRKRKPRQKPAPPRPKGEIERLAVRRCAAMKYRLAGASYRAIAEKLTEERAQAYADEHGVSVERAMKKIPHVSVRTV